MSINFMALCVKSLFSATENDPNSEEDFSDLDTPKRKKKKADISFESQSTISLSLV